MHAAAGFVDVAVTLAIPNLLTFSLEGIDVPVAPGMRVVVQVGARRLYTGVVWRVHGVAPSDYAVRPVEAVVDDEPVLTPGQMALFDWMAAYYLCTRGEVLAAALPSGLKLTSETRLVLHPRWAQGGRADGAGLGEGERRVLEALSLREGLSMKEVATLLGVVHPQRVVNRLLQGDWVMTEEEVKSRWRPEVERWVVPGADWPPTEEGLGDLLDGLGRRSPRQAALVMGYLRAAWAGGEPGAGSGAGSEGGSEGSVGVGVLEKELLEATGCSRAILRTLVDRGLFRTEERLKDRWAAGAERLPASWKPAPLPQLSPAQVDALQALRAAAPGPALLHGVTGSGKTEVFIHLMADALERGGQVLLLVPEIALTTQLIGRLGLYFAPYLAVYHSRFNTRERTETYLDVLRGGSQGSTRGRLVVGPRSAVLLPLADLALVIVDEEHEPSYKQQDPAPRYQARDVAVWLARQQDAPVVLASATPSLESEWNVQQGRFQRVSLLERFGGARLPTIETVDLRQAMRERSMQGHLTLPLQRAMEATLAQGKQVMLFQNRRGYAPMWLCGTCGWVPECPRCDVALTHHKVRGQLNCHHCGYQLVPPPPACARCGADAMRSQGLGTQRLEEEVAERFPDARVARMDLDSTRSREAHGRLVADFARQAYDILVGTQMITKGLDFAHVGLVGVLGADRLLNFPDFRSFERAYAMLTQVAGRAGRRGDPGASGRVLLQTFAPDHWVLGFVQRQDHAGFVNREMADRENHHMPPFSRMIRLTLRYIDAELVQEAAHALAHRLRQRFGERVLGPETPAIARVNDLHHQVVLLNFERSLSPTRYKPLLLEDVRALGQDARWKRVRVIVDVDPY